MALPRAGPAVRNNQVAGNHGSGAVRRILAWGIAPCPFEQLIMSNDDVFGKDIARPKFLTKNGTVCRAGSW